MLSASVPLFLYLLLTIPTTLVRHITSSNTCAMRLIQKEEQQKKSVFWSIKYGRALLKHHVEMLYSSDCISCKGAHVLMDEKSKYGVFVALKVPKNDIYPISVDTIHMFSYSINIFVRM